MVPSHPLRPLRYIATFPALSIDCTNFYAAKTIDNDAIFCTDSGGFRFGGKPRRGSSSFSDVVTQAPGRSCQLEYAEIGVLNRKELAKLCGATVWQSLPMKFFLCSSDKQSSTMKVDKRTPAKRNFLPLSESRTRATPV
ncbi:unnamed protein product [Clavelina lepadiformis]|uniref:Uncharacterized protein n=1 Tax=Clavelina lepadiformis TaxID=159417 RepID=A0ABP0FUA6_CLALP